MKTDTFLFNQPGTKDTATAQSVVGAPASAAVAGTPDEGDFQSQEERAIAARNLERFLADPENRSKRWQQAPSPKSGARRQPAVKIAKPPRTGPPVARDASAGSIAALDAFASVQDRIQVQFGEVPTESVKAPKSEPVSQPIPLIAAPVERRLPPVKPAPSADNAEPTPPPAKEAEGNSLLSVILRTASFLVLLCLVWVPTLAYVSLAKPSYVSTWRLILPGDGLQSALKLEDVGQATASSKSVFSSRNFDPRATYREIAMSGIVETAAADSLAIPHADFESPKIKTVPETAILEFQIKRSSPAIAQSHAIAFLQSFDDRVNQLRAAEVSSRQRVAQDTLDELRVQLEDKHAARLELQRSGGVLSSAQFDRMVTAAETLRENLTRETAALKELQGQFRALAESLDITPRVASWALTLKGDRLFQNIAEAYATAETEVSSLEGTLGPRHPTLIAATVRRDAFRQDLYDRSRAVIGAIPDELMMILDLTSNPERSKLFAKLLETRAALAGKHAQVKDLNETLRKSDSKTAWLVEDVGKLSALTQEAKVAEAVFTAALADIDLSRSNPFASYPLYQLLDAPSLPSKASSPWKKEAIAGALAATFLIILAFVALWIRRRIPRARSRKAA